MSADTPAALTWPGLITDLIAARDLSAHQTSWAMRRVMRGEADPIALAGFLVALAAKGETVAELRGLADEMLAHAVPVAVASTRTVDIVGTGGDRHRSVNISTMAALVVAGAGLPVVKHGNRAASSASGSADVLEALGIKLRLTPERAAELVDEVGITFLFAQQFHPAFRHAAAARAGLGVATAFNVLGPLTNPGRPGAGAIGVGNERMAPLMAGVFAERGNHTLVFRSDDGLDELSPTSPAHVWEVTEATGGVVVPGRIDPARDLGLAPATLDDLRGGDPTFNAAVARRLFAGQGGPVRDAVMLNAAAAFVADATLPGTREGTLPERLTAGLGHAAASLDEGAAADVLAAWVSASQR
ncbi:MULTISPECIES: anthranilate phosphoribosyltransferase [unclassified Pseudactinotalea]|uniref:anthranilate phosphoribosyltransferase n=1 Tax=unclassified Pseudactinotalea TaxID=2649176 RepID=UPI00128CA258|nr:MULTISPECIES: anthranilate phosphoribosyltransferase [unclassified Pseudactinotalea]MPV49447.1 anthranilate phosphoribosyltransferase [Pseudactinotalea sp. HY160]QGH69264.1 anthranilate phosphoribosyltransferase [Pseudactinotalea sp. HY158]